jgi:manganese/zinc/iron transport system substrate-binding protein
MRVVASIGVVRDLLENVGGPSLHVDTLLGPGTDPHVDTDPSRYVSLLLHAERIFTISLGLEPSLARAEDEDRSERIHLRSLTGGISRDDLLACPRTGSIDPHVWQDAALWAGRTENVAWHLSRMLPVEAHRYQANAEQYRERLLRLDAYVREQVARIAPERRVLVTAHDAFGYFGRAYGFRVRGLQGIETSLLASTDHEVEALADWVVAEHVPVLFTETSVGTGGLERVQRAVRARGRDVRIAGPLYSDAMGKRGTPHGTYGGMMRHNVDTIVAALTRTD